MCVDGESENLTVSVEDDDDYVEEALDEEEVPVQEILHIVRPIQTHSKNVPIRTLWTQSFYCCDVCISKRTVKSNKIRR